MDHDLEIELAVAKDASRRDRYRTVLFIAASLALCVAVTLPNRLPVHWPSVIYGFYIGCIAHWWLAIAGDHR
jgi:hypothetical protein